VVIRGVYEGGMGYHGVGSLQCSPPEAKVELVNCRLTGRDAVFYGYSQTIEATNLKVPAQIHGVARQRISDMTIQPGPTWGVGIATWHTLGEKLWNLDVRGGFYAVGDLFYGAQYVFDVRDCVLSGSEAAFNGSSNISYFTNVTIKPVGRFGMLFSGSNNVLDGVTFEDPQTHRSEYYFRHVATAIYGGMNTLLNVTAKAPRHPPLSHSPSPPLSSSLPCADDLALRVDHDIITVAGLVVLVLAILAGGEQREGLLAAGGLLQ